MNSIIKVEGLGKLYRLGEVGTGTLSHDLHRWWAKIRHKEDPYAQVGEINDRTSKGSSDYVWALRNIDFEIFPGEVVGIIGRNGAGKSTLLKLLSKVTKPTEGFIKLKGRVASLLEVGTGFHPELTGRENVYLNGAILGMTKIEVSRKFDEIVDFSGVERYIDTPVKRYSSGMYVRLAFAVAAFLEPEILIVDEVLAVGDAEFQEKCLGRLKKVSANEGRTVLFVSHSMAAIKQLCTRGVLMSKGGIEMTGEVPVVIQTYLSGFLPSGDASGEISEAQRLIKSKDVKIKKVSLLNRSKDISNFFLFKEPIQLDAELHVNSIMPNCMVDITVSNSTGDTVAYTCTNEHHSFEKGTYNLFIQMNNFFLPGEYLVNIGIHKATGQTLEYIQSAKKFSVSKVAVESQLDYPFDWTHGNLHIDSKWQIKRL